MESISETTRSARDFANGQINNFIENVEDLTHALKDVDTPEIARVKAKVKIALAAARSALADGAAQVILGVPYRNLGEQQDGIETSPAAWLTSLKVPSPLFRKRTLGP